VIEPAIYTVGYGREDFAHLKERLQALGIVHLVDVRTSPYSRYQAEFRPGVIDRCCEEAGLIYAYRGDLLGGKPSQAALQTDGKADWSKVRAWRPFQTAVNEVIRQAESGPVALLCGCEWAHKCHRGGLLTPAFADKGVNLQHIGMDGVPRSLEEEIARQNGGQLGFEF
jgi:hypothetical protein